MSVEISSAAALLNQMQSQAARADGQSLSGGDKAGQSGGATSFGEALAHSIDRIDALKSEAVTSGQAYERGTPGVGLNDVMVNMAKADVATNMGIQVRNRVVSAYQDIMNMQV